LVISFTGRVLVFFPAWQISGRRKHLVEQLASSHGQLPKVAATIARPLMLRDLAA
jgi:hypothetical protein